MTQGMARRMLRGITESLRIRGVAAVCVLLLAGPLGALEVKDGRIKLILHEDLGRYSVYHLSDLQKGTYVPLFVDTDPRTSSMTLVVDNRVTRLGESSDFQQEIKRTAGGAEFIWSSRLLQVRQSFELVTSSASQLADGVRITVTAKNLGEQPLQIGLRILVDTYLGEEGTSHFMLDGSTQVTRETELTGTSRPAYWASPRQNDSSGLALVWPTAGEGIDSPDRVVFANWQRLNDASWTFQASAARNFSNLPYSINDSAVAMYYGPRPIESGSAFAVTALLASSGAGTFRLASTAAPAPATPAAATPPAVGTVASTTAAAEALPAARTDLAALNELLRAIDARLRSSSGATEQEIAALRAALRDLTAKVRKYGAAPAESPRQ